MANTVIKISQLANINGNLTSNTLLPVVSTNGTFVTDKVNVTNLANFILQGAGNTFSNVGLSQLAYNVVNAAQPNITSVGTLSNLNVSGDSNLGDVSGLTILGGENGYFLQTNGGGTLSWSAAPGSGNGAPGGANTQVQFNDNGLFAGNPGLTFDQTTDTLGTVNFLVSSATVYDNLYAGNLLVNSNLTSENILANNFTANTFSTSNISVSGNIEANYFIGNGSQLTGVTAVAVAGGPNTSVQFNNNGVIYGNSDLTYDEANSTLSATNVLAVNLQVTNVTNVVDVNFTGNIQNGNLVSATHLAGDGANITNVTANFSNYSNVANTANAVAVANVVGIGNIATVSLDGNSSNILFGNGVFANTSGITLLGDGGNLSNINGANVVGNVSDANYAYHVDVMPTVENFSFHIVMVANPGDNQLKVDDDDHLQYNPSTGTLTTTTLTAEFIAVNDSVLSNLNPFVDASYSLGNATHRWNNLYLTGSTIYLDDATISANGNSIVVDSITVTNGNVGTVGNIAGLNLDGSSSNVLYGNGVFAPASGGGNATLPLANGNSNFDIATANGNATITSNGTYTWTFGDDGSTIFPTLTVDLHNGGNQSAQTLQFGDPTQQAIITGPTPAPDTAAQRLIIQGQRGNGLGEGGDVYLWAGDAEFNGGDIKIYAGDADDGSAGSGGYINLDGGSGFNGGGQISVTGGYSSGGQGGPVYISAGQGTDGGVVNINGGGASTATGGYVNIQGGFGQGAGGAVTIAGGGSALGLPGYGNVQITAGVSTWTFDNGGNLTLPDNTSFQNFGSGSSEWHAGANGYVSLASNNGNTYMWVDNDGAYIGTNWIPGSYTWTFDNTGNLTAPGAINVGNMVIGTVPGDITADNNTTVAFNATGSDGGFLVNYLKEVGNANTSGGELAFSSETGNATYRISLSNDLGDGFATKIWRFDGTGNLTLPGNTFAVNYANGAQVPLGGGGGNTGNVTFNDQVIQGTGDEYGGSGLYLAPGTNSTANLQFLRVRGGDYPTHIHLDTGNNNYFDQYFGADFRYVKLEANGNIVINADDDEGNSATWTFDTTGDLQLASGNSVISSLPNNAGDGSGLSTLNLYPDSSTVDDRYLIIDPTGPAHLHLRAGGLQDASNVLLYLGGEQTYVQVDDGYHRVTIGSYDIGNTTGYNWRFDYDGNLVLPLNTFAVKYANGTQVPIVSSASGSNNQIQFNSNGAFGASGNYTFTDTVGGGSVEVGNELLLLGNGTISTSSNNLNIQPAGNLVVTASAYNWTFDLSGNLTLPGNTFNINYANGSQASAPLVDVLNTNGLTTVFYPTFVENRTDGQIVRADVDLSYRSDTNTLTVGNITGNTNGYTLGYLNIPQVSASNTTLGLTDAGKHYYSTTAGNLTLTIPNNSTTSFATGTAISIVVQAAGNVLVNAASGVTLYMAGSSTAGNRVVGTYGMATLMKVASDTWFINGTGVY